MGRRKSQDSQEPFTEIGRIVDKTLKDPVFPTPPVKGFWDKVPLEEQEKIFANLKEKWEYQSPFSLEKFIIMVSEFLPGDTYVNKDKLSRTRNMGNPSMVTGSIVKVDENFIARLALFANLKGTEIEEYHEAEAEDKYSQILKIAHRDAQTIRQAKIDSKKQPVKLFQENTGTLIATERTAQKTISRNKPKESFELATIDTNLEGSKDIENKNFTETVRDTIKKSGFQSFIAAGLTEEEVWSLSAGEKPGVDMLGALCIALSLSGDEMLTLIKNSWVRKQPTA
jgi:hypothetical protein